MSVVGGIIGGVAQLALGGYSRIVVGVKSAVKWSMSHPSLAALALSLACNVWLWRGWDEAEAKRAQVQQKFDDFVKQARTASDLAKAAQEAVNAKQEQDWKEKADEADATIDDLRSDLARSLRAGANRGSSGPAYPAAENHGSGVSQDVPPTTTGDSQPVQVTTGYCWDADKLADLSAYAIKAHEWAATLDEDK